MTQNSSRHFHDPCLASSLKVSFLPFRKSWHLEIESVALFFFFLNVDSGRTSPGTAQDGLQAQGQPSTRPN